jgi:membrane protein implicated in regulation of membrane protease activity
MFLLLGRRYPWISLVGGAVFLVIGIVAGSMVSVVIGCLGLVIGGARMLASWRRGNGLLGPGRGGASGMLR